MEPSTFISMPKTPRKETSRNERFRIQTLYFDANWTQADIALQLNLTLGQVKYALAHQITPPKTHASRKAYLINHNESV